MALSCWRSTYSRWLRPISSWTCVLIFSRTFKTSSWRERNCSTVRMRALRSKVSSTSCFSSTWMSRLDVIRSASWPGSVTLSTSAPASLGSSGMSLMTRLAMSFRFITSASSSTSVEVGSGTAETRARMNGSCCVYSATRMRDTPWRITLKLSFASLITFRIRAAQPTEYMSPSVGSSVRASRWVRMPITGRSFETASSTRRTLLRRPTSMGMIDPGKSTEFLSGRIGRMSGTSTGPPVSGGPTFILVIDSPRVPSGREPRSMTTAQSLLRGLGTYDPSSGLSRRLASMWRRFLVGNENCGRAVEFNRDDQPQST